jgi:hypothetical protein
VLENPVPYPKTTQAVELESRGFEVWLKTLGARTFTGSFSYFHREKWAWYWRITMKRLRGEPLADDELAFLAIWFRGGGKSSHVEWACIAEGAVLGEGYVLYACETEGQALDHVAAIRDRLESSEIAYYYPGLASPEVGLHGNQIGWSKDYLATASGWGIIPVGLEQGIRGGRKKDLRFTMIVLDDVDSEKDSPAQVEKKIKVISRSILPAGQADTITLFAQNLIDEDSVLNQIYTRRTDVLSERIVSGPVKAFEDLELEVDETNHVWRIKSCAPTWPDIDMAAARRFLAKSGRSAFLAEYQHDFTDDRTEKVLPNWDDDVHVITEEEFEAIYGAKEPPDRWYKYGGNDWSKTKSAYHANVSASLTVAGQFDPLPGFIFMFNALSYEAGTLADDVGLAMLKTISPTVTVEGVVREWEELVQAQFEREGLSRYVPSPTERLRLERETLAKVIPQYVRPLLEKKRYKRFRGSHEQANDALRIYNDCFGLPFQPANPGEGGGIEWINHYQKVDYERPHPFKPGQMGYARFFLVVKKEQAAYPSAVTPDRLHGSDLARYQFKHWRNRPIKVSESGAIEYGPMKMNDDYGNLLMMQFFDGAPQAAPMTEGERITALTPPESRFESLRIPGKRGMLPHDEISYLAARDMARETLRPKSGKRDMYGNELDD